MSRNNPCTISCLRQGNSKIAVISMSLCVLITSISWMFMRIPSFYEKFIVESSFSSWMMYGYIIAEVSMVIVAGVLVDKIGSNNVMLVGMPLFVGGSLGVYMIEPVEGLVALRVIQGLGAGFIFSTALSFIPQSYPKSKRSNPHKLMTLTFAVGSIFGTAIGYYFVVTVGDWKLFMLIAAIVVAVFGMLAYFNLPTAEHTFINDTWGMVLTIAAIASIMTYSQMVGVEFDLMSIESLAFIEFCLLMVALLIFREWKTKDPMIPHGMVKRNHIGLVSGMFLAGFCGIGMLQFIIIFLMVYYALPLYDASGMLLFLIAGGAITSVVGSKLVYKIGIRPLALVAPILCMMGFVGFYFLASKSIEAAGASLFVLGLGFGCIVTEIAISIQSISPVRQGGSMTSLLMSSRFVGIILGMAVYNSIIKNSLSEFIERSGDKGQDIVTWLINHAYEYATEIVSAFKEIIAECSLIAGVAIVSVFVMVYFLVDEEDIDSPEVIE